MDRNLLVRTFLIRAFLIRFFGEKMFLAGSHFSPPGKSILSGFGRRDRWVGGWHRLGVGDAHGRDSDDWFADSHGFGIGANTPTRWHKRGLLPPRFSSPPVPRHTCPKRTGSVHTEKYFACGWWTTMAEVDCSGSSWSSSLSVMPISSARSRSNSCFWSARLGQAG